MSDQSVPVGAVSLSDAIVALRRELLTAWKASQGSYLHFRPSAVELTLQVGVTSVKGANAGVKWWLIDAGAEASKQLEAVQTIKLTLDPVVVDADGTQTEFLVSDVENRLVDRE